jgi:hypothetical protein
MNGVSLLSAQGDQMHGVDPYSQRRERAFRKTFRKICLTIS